MYCETKSTSSFRYDEHWTCICVAICTELSTPWKMNLSKNATVFESNMLPKEKRTYAVLILENGFRFSYLRRPHKSHSGRSLKSLKRSHCIHINVPSASILDITSVLFRMKCFENMWLRESDSNKDLFKF